MMAESSAEGCRTRSPQGGEVVPAAGHQLHSSTAARLESLCPPTRPPQGGEHHHCHKPLRLASVQNLQQKMSSKWSMCIGVELGFLVRAGGGSHDPNSRR
ncbi:hypothetical protein V6N13_101451 [Hibiscus sabdariffa]